MAEFYKYVPKGLQANLQYRITVRERAATDEGFRNAMMSACEQDALFFFNAFCWLYEPRPRKAANGKKLPNTIPFITWSHQDDAVLQIKENLGFEDLGVEKSRGEGASWISILLALHDWLFDPMCSIGVVSRTENAVDSPDDSDSLLWKFDWEITKLPYWMQPDWESNSTRHTRKNCDNGSMVTGYAATGDVASGGRKKWFLMDELAKFPRGADSDAMASTQHVTDSRLVVSTPKGSEGEYYRVMHEPSSMVRIILDWSQNPTRNRGLYEFRNGKPVAVDPSNPLPENYAEKSKDLFSRLRRKGYKLEECLRSPWFDHECDRPGATPKSIAQELCRDYGGSMYRIFGHDFFGKVELTVREPFFRGILDYDDDLEPEFHRTDDGPIQLWTPLSEVGKKPPVHPYVIGADICTGVGGAFTSNSVVQVYDLVTMEQVLEYATNTVNPENFADVCMAIGYWFYEAYLAWEVNGPGTAFTKRVKDKQYPNVYYRTPLTKRGRKKSKELGWFTSPSSKELMFSELRRSCTSGELTLRSKAMSKECGQYVRLNGKIEHVSSKSKDDSTSGASHGDRVISACVALQAIRDRPLPSEDLQEHLAIEPPMGSMAERQREYDNNKKRENDVWDDRETSDLMGNNYSKWRVGA